MAAGQKMLPEVRTPRLHDTRCWQEIDVKSARAADAISNGTVIDLNSDYDMYLASVYRVSLGTLPLSE